MMVAEALGNLREELNAYFGAINERKFITKTVIPPKPEMLIYYEQVELLGLPMFSGGLSDQPHIFIQAYKVVDSVVKLFRELERIANETQTQGG